MPNIIVAKNPLNYTIGDEVDYIYDNSENLSVEEYLKKHSIDVEGSIHPRICLLNSIDNPLFRKEYPTTFPKKDDSIIILPLMQGGGGSNPLKLILGLALVVFAAPIAGMFAGALGISTVVVARFGTALLLSGLVAKPKIKIPSNSTPEAASVYSLTAQGNMARIKGYIPSIYGRMNIFPDYMAQPFVTFFKDTNKQHLIQCFMIGHGEYEFEEVKVADTPINNFPELNWAQLYFNENGSMSVVKSYKSITGLGNANTKSTSIADFNTTWDATHFNYTSSVEVSGQLLYGANEPEYAALDNGWSGAFVVNRSGTTITEIQVDLQCQGLGYVNDKAGIDARTVSWSLQARKVNDIGEPITLWAEMAYSQSLSGVDSKTAAQIFPNIATGTWKGDYGIKYADKPVTIVIDLGHRGTTGHINVGNTKNTTITKTAGSAAYNTNDKVTVTTTAYSALENYQSQGDWGGTYTSYGYVWHGTVKIQFSYSETVPIIAGSKTAATRSPLAWTLSFPVEVGRYQVRMKRTNNRSGLSNYRVMDELRWVGLKGVLSTPPKLQNMTVLYVRLVASDSISGQASQKINAVVKRKLPRYVTDSWVAADLVEYQNPIWAMVDMIKAFYGGKLTDEAIDLSEIQTLAYKANQRGDTFNYCFSEKMSLFDALSLVGQTCRIHSILRWNKIRFTRDEPKSVVKAIFTEQTIKKGTLSVDYIMPNNDATWIEAEFFNEVGWRWDTVEIGDKQANPANTQPIKVRFEGITNKDQVIREAKFRLNAARYRKKIVSFETNQSGFLPNFLDFIRVAHSLLEWGSSGNLVSAVANGATSYTLTLDRDITWDGSTSYRVVAANKAGVADMGSIGFACTKVSNRALNMLTADYNSMLSLAGGSFVFTGMPDTPTKLLVGSNKTLGETVIITDRIPRADGTVKLIGFSDKVLNISRPDAHTSGVGSPIFGGSSEFTVGGAGQFTIPTGVTKIKIRYSGGIATEDGAGVYAAYEPNGSFICKIDPTPPNVRGSTTPTGISIKTIAGVTTNYDAFPVMPRATPTQTEQTITVAAGDVVSWRVYKAPTPLKGTVDSACSPTNSPLAGRIGADGYLYIEFI